MPHPAQNPHVRYVPVGTLPVTKRPRGFVRYLVLVAVALLIVWAFTSCAPAAGTVPRHVPIEAPPKAKAVDLTPALRSTSEATRSNVQASGSVSRISAELAAVKLDLRSTVSEADRLRKLKVASEAELEALWRNLTDLSVRHDAIEREATAAKSALDSQTGLLRNVEDHLGMARKDAEAKEAEAQVLRSSLAASERLRASSDEALATANESAAKNAAIANNARGERNLWRWIAGIAGLIGLLIALLPIILRAIKPI